MHGEALRTKSVDAGESWVFANIMGNPIKSFDAKGHIATITYDELHRPIAKHIEGNGIAKTQVEEISYIAPDTPFIDEKNLRGQVLYHKDGAGMSVTPAYGFKGNPLSSSYMLRDIPTNPDGSIDNSVADVTTSTYTGDMYTSKVEIDALERAVHAHKPDGSITSYTYKDSGTLKTVDVQLEGDVSQPFVLDIHHDEYQNYCFGNRNKFLTSVVVAYVRKRNRRFLSH